jgi:hypothetical protein
MKLENLESEINEYLMHRADGDFSQDIELNLSIMEHERNTLLKAKEDCGGNATGLYGYKAETRIQSSFINTPVIGEITSTYGRF